MQNLLSSDYSTIRRGLFIVVLLFLTSCSDEVVKPPDYQAQRSLFLSVIELVQQAGGLLQKKPLLEDDIKQSMALLDSAMFKANTVDSSFLKWVDAGLYQAFTGYLVKGVENYRLGYAYEEKAQQAQGIEQLQQWWHFWQLKRPAVLKKLESS